jgi:hypothetical protein
MRNLQEPRRAVRMVGLKLLLLSVSLAALGAVAPGEQHSIAEATWGGMKLLHLILGTAAAGASLFLRPQVNGKLLGATISCGILCAIAGTPLLAWAFTAYLEKPFPGPLENALAIAMGVGGIYIIPGLQSVSEAFKSNPLGFIDWLRGKGSPPAPPSDKGSQP